VEKVETEEVESFRVWECESGREPAGVGLESWKGVELKDVEREVLGRFEAFSQRDPDNGWS